MAVPSREIVASRAPAAIVAKLHQETVRVLQRDDVKEKFFSAGADVVASTPEYFGEAVKKDMARMSKVIKNAGIRDE